MDCLFCKIINGEIPSYKIYEDSDVLCFLDINPMSMGHTLIIPKKHFTDINDINSEDLNKVMSTSKIIVNLLKEKLKPNGIRLLQNNGSVQEVKHFHLHIIPIYTNNKKQKNVEDVFNILTK